MTRETDRMMERRQIFEWLASTCCPIFNANGQFCDVATNSFLHSNELKRRLQITVAGEACDVLRE